MSASAIIFYFIAAFILIAALLSVTTKKIFRAAIWLLFSLVGISGLYFWLQVEFIAAVQIIVYVGGIVVLIIFSIFLTQQSGKEMAHPSRYRSVFSILAVCFGAALTLLLLNKYIFKSADTSQIHANVSDIGSQMLSLTEHGYILPFEVVSILLLAAMVGSIVIAIKNPFPNQTNPKVIQKANK